MLGTQDMGLDEEKKIVSKAYEGIPEVDLERISEGLEQQTNRIISKSIIPKEINLDQQKEKKGKTYTTSVEEKTVTNRPPYLYYFLFFLGSLLYLEIIFHLHQYGNIDGVFVASLFFLIPVACIYTVLAAIGGRVCRKVLSFSLISVTVLMYFTYLVYYYVFKAYLSVYSITTGTGQVLEFWRDILSAVVHCLPWLFVLAVPIPWLGILHYFISRRGTKRKRSTDVEENTRNTPKIEYSSKKNRSTEEKKAAWIHRGIWTGGLMAGAAVLQTILVLSLPIFGRGLYTPYDLYHYTSAMELSVKSLGLYTSAALDLKRLLFGMRSAPVDFEDIGWNDNAKDNQTEVLPPGREEGDGGTGQSTPPAINTATGSGADTGTGPAAEVPQVTVDRSPNILDINFEKLIKKAPNEEVATMHKYFSSIVPTDKNEYTGMFKGYNLIMITAEGFSPYAVDEKLTPTLYRLSREGFVFSNFYTPLWAVSTSDGEYVACTGTIPKSGVWSMYKSSVNEMPFAFGNQFRRLGYQTQAYHNHTFDYYRRDISHPNLGYDFKAVGNGLEIKESWPESDLEMMEATIPEYIGNQPFHTYYMTVSGHMYYTFTGNAMSYKHKREVEGLPYSDEARAYVACNIELDQALEKLIGDLTEAGIAENTVIALSADHYPYGLPKAGLDELAGHKVEENFEIYRNSFFLWTASMKDPVIIDKAAGSLDIAPTLSNLFGLPYDSRLYMGRDILSDAPPLVIFSNRSFISDLAMYNSTTREAVLLDGNELPDGYVSGMNKVINNKFKFSAAVLEQNYYQYFLPYLDKKK